MAAAYLVNAQAREDAHETSELHRQRALHDALTGLPNRLLLQDRLRHAGQRARRTHGSVAILFIDLDDFKTVNDTHGHHVGDELLAAVARRLESLVRADDTLARVSGDEFVFLCENLADRADAEVLLQRVRESFEVPFDLSDVELTLGASVGLAVAGPGETVSDQLMVEADAAMYRAKREGSSPGRLRVRRATCDLEASSLGRQLRSAIANDELGIAYQPQVRSDDGRIVGVEALLRWADATRGPVPPSIVVAVAERSNLISEIGAWVLQRGFEDHGRWLRNHPGLALDLAVNVSVRQLLAPDFADTVARALTATATRPATVVLEVTESVLLDDAGRARTVLNELRETGVRIALDDFGTGFSSLHHLRQLPVDIVKIDRSFVADIDEESGGGAVLAAVANLAHVLQLPVTAEGVETRQQHDQISAIGCELAQGYFYARPMPAASIEQLLGGDGGGAGRPATNGHPIGASWGAVLGDSSG